MELSQVKTIKLTQGKLALIDARDYEHLNKYKWHFSSGYAMRTVDNHYKLGGKKYTIMMHREIAETPKDKITDHVNGDKLDNRRSNLRICNKSENALNAGAWRHGSSGFRGVHWRAGRNRWQAKLRVNGKYLVLGSFKDPKKAAEAYDMAVKKYYPVFGKTNLGRA